MSVTIPESGMRFGPFDDDAVFQVEMSVLRTGLGDRVKSPEFVLHRHDSSDALWFVEAKSSSPHPGNTADFDAFLDEIAEKLVHGLTLFLAARLNRHADTAGELSSRLRSVDLAVVKLRLVLVIKGHKKEWLPQLQDALRKVLDVARRLWGIDARGVLVMNDEMAIKHGLIATPAP